MLACIFCEQGLGMTHDILVEWPFSQHRILCRIRATCSPANTGDTLLDWWLKARRETPKTLMKGLTSTVLLTLWMLQKHCKDCTPDGARPNLPRLFGIEKEEGY
jgi:hypothetical protein